MLYGMRKAVTTEFPFTSRRPIMREVFMPRVLGFVKQVAGRRPATIGVLIAIIALSLDFTVGREIQFPLLYAIPVAMTAWLGKKRLAYALSILLPSVRVIFEELWHLPESMATVSVNAGLEVLALFFYVYLVDRQSGRTVDLKSAITIEHEKATYLRAFSRMMGTALQGRGISPGMADGVALVYVPDQYTAFGDRHISPEEVESEAAS